MPRIIPAPVSTGRLHAGLVAGADEAMLDAAWRDRSPGSSPALVGDHDVARLEIAMDDAGAVGGGERIGDLDAVAQRIGDAQALVSESACRGCGRARTPSPGTRCRWPTRCRKW